MFEETMFERVISLIGKDNYNKLKTKRVLIVGIGGVGGMALECLVRSGVSNIGIIDHDIFDVSNLNRQIICNIYSINKNKVDIAKEKYSLINPKLNLTAYKIFLDESNIDLLDKYDYVIDACDSINTKIEIIKYCKKKNINLISSMGMGNRLNPGDVYITRLDKTTNDPLAKKIRNILRKEKIDLKVNVVASKEIPIKSSVISSMISVPSVAGIYIADFIIYDIIK